MMVRQRHRTARDLTEILYEAIWRQKTNCLRRGLLSAAGEGEKGGGGAFGFWLASLAAAGRNDFDVKGYAYTISEPYCHTYCTALISCFVCLHFFLFFYLVFELIYYA